MAIMGRENAEVTKWLLNADSWKKELKELSRDLRTHERHLKDIATVNKAMSASTQNIETGLKSMASGLAATIVKSNLFTMALSKTKDVLFDLIGQTSEYSRVIINFKGDIEKAKQATGGLVSTLDLVKASNRLNILGVKLSEEEYAKALRGIKKLAFAMGLDMQHALDSFATGVARQSRLMLDNIGLIVNAKQSQENYAHALGKSVKELTEAEKQIAFQKEAITQLDFKQGELSETIETVTDKIQRQTISIKDWALEIFNALNKMGDLRKQMEGANFIPGSKENIEAMERLFGGKGFTQKTQVEFDRTLKATVEYINAVEDAKNKGLGEYSEKLFGLGLGFFGTGGELRGGKKKKRGAKKAEKGIAGIDFTPPSFVATAEDAERAEQQLTEASVLPILNQMKQENIRLSNEQAMVSKMQLDTLNDNLIGMDQSIQRYKELAEIIRRANDVTKEMVAGALVDMGAGLWDVADAALSSGESFGLAMGKMVKSTLLGLAKQATVEALWETAKGLAALARYDFGAAGNHFAAAGTFAAVAGVAGGVGLGMSAVMSNAQGSGEKKESADRQSTFKQSFGNRVENNQPININVYLGDPNNPQTALMMQKQLQAQIVGI